MLDVNILFNNRFIDEEQFNESNSSFLIPLVEAVSRITGQSMFVVDYDKQELIYKSKQLLYVDEATSADIKRICANPYWSLVSDQVLEKLIIIRKNYIVIGEDFSKDHFREHINIIDYPISLRGHELYITQKFVPLITGSNGYTKIGLFSISHSSETEINSYIITQSGRRYRFDFDKEEYVKFDLDATLTIAEKAILHRARMGMTNEMIAGSLFLSVNTVKSHKLRIFKKLGVNTITEALTVVGNYYLI